MTALLGDNVQAVHALNALLEAELSATDTYRQAIDRLGSSAPIEVLDCLQSHQIRANYISERITDLHGQPTVNHAVWATCVNLLEEDSGPLYRMSVLSALRYGELHSLTQYHDCISDLDVESLLLVKQVLLPEEHRTLLVMSSLFQDTH